MIEKWFIQAVRHSHTWQEPKHWMSTTTDFCKERQLRFVWPKWSLVLNLLNSCFVTKNSLELIHEDCGNKHAEQRTFQHQDHAMQTENKSVQYIHIL